MNIVIVEAPAAPAISLQEAYEFLRLDPEGSPPEHPDDAMLLQMIEAATQKVEAATNRRLVQQTIRLVLPSFTQPTDANGRPVTGIELKPGPFIEMVSVKYLDAGSNEVTVDEDTYSVSQNSFVPKLYTSTAWPTTATSRTDAVRIEYVVGYPPVDSSDLTGNIPAGLKAAVKWEVQLQYDELSPEKRTQIEASIARILGQFRIHSF